MEQGPSEVLSDDQRSSEILRMRSLSQNGQESAEKFSEAFTLALLLLYLSAKCASSKIILVCMQAVASWFQTPGLLAQLLCASLQLSRRACQISVLASLGSQAPNEAGEIMADHAKSWLGKLAVWILAAKLPNSDLNFAVDLGWILSSWFFRENSPKKPPKTSLVKFTRKFARRNSPRILQKPFLDNWKLILSSGLT